MLADGLQSQFQKHSVEYYYKEIMQTSHLQKKHKKAGSWNAFLPPSVLKKKVNNFIGEIAAKWKSLSDEEKAQLTEEKVTTLHNTREMRDLAFHNVPISAFHNIHATFNNLNEEVQQLHAWTGIEVLMLANYVEENTHLHSEMSSLILYKLIEEVTSAKISRMYYHSFDIHITTKYGVVVKSWPLKMFCSSSEITSCTELKIILNAWKTDTTRFYKMMCNEFKAWKTQQFNALNALTNNAYDGGSASIGYPSTLATPLHTSGVPGTASAISILTPTPTPLSMNIVNTVSGGDGSMVFVMKKPWKVRKDKGIERKKPTTPETVGSAK
ncbi:hypothetical protein C0995_009408 [Termitomyces sp. Mi166|nr:hypothetical protein C0995_009408 [Termitomyces sp. Mi166\